ncbi:hypothetical protein [Thalassoroseus pseudoceratinae]|uniref:hypothetical protein n=1 Tax=Thalassoroseus pseudoceratinae TaxID=2713176 RepID=UPI00142277F0|nr:hypothetical protein [Thalassoroseus pseudoceratinae]
MSIGNVYTIGSVYGLDGTGGSNFELHGVDNLSIDPGVQEILESAAGQPDPSYVATMSNEAMITFTASDIATALGNIDALAGLSVVSGATNEQLECYFTKMASNGTRSDGTSHLKVTLNKALVVPRTLTARQGEKATLDVEVHGIYDGSNNPFVYTDTVSLPDTPSLDEMFTVGKATINGTDLDGITGLTVDFGLTVQKEMSDGDVWPTFAAITTRQPRIELTTREAVSLSTFGLAGTAQTSSATAVYLRKIAEQGTRVADNTAEHIKISLSSSQGMISVGQTGGSNNAPSDCTVVIRPVAGSSAIMTVSTASAIT